MEVLQEHNKRSHALLSASGASRWINCPPSARLEEEFGETKSTKYAKEGTLAHELSELYLSRDVLKVITDQDFNEKLESILNNSLFTEEMLDMVPAYTDYCSSQLAEAQTLNPSAFMEIEQKLDLTMYVPESFGTADCIIINDNCLEIIDLKYGKGIPVSADWNKQLMLYGLGALYKYELEYNIENIKLTIVQPRLDSISSFLISTNELVTWAETELKPAAELAFEGKGELNSGEWCRFCAIRNRCRELYNQQLELAKHEFSKPQLISDEEIADLIKRAPKFVEWLDSIQEYARTKAITENYQWPGLKLVEGRSQRKWIDEEQASAALMSRCPELTQDEIYSLKLNSITTMEKLIGKKRFADLLSDVIIKPQGKLALAPIEDKRPAAGIAQAKIDFQE